MVIRNCLSLLAELSNIEKKIAILEPVAKQVAPELDLESMLQSLFDDFTSQSYQKEK